MTSNAIIYFLRLAIFDIFTIIAIFFGENIMNSESNSNHLSSGFSPILLSGRTALVTGAGKGIGREIVLKLCRAGAKVVAVARTECDISQLYDQFPSQVIPCVMDATRPEFLTYIQGCDVDILVNNLGTNRPGPFCDVSTDDLNFVIDLNIKTLIQVTQVVVGKMLERHIAGSVVNISSQMGHIGAVNRTIYCATKHAVEGLTKALAVEFAPNGIRVNSVAPTFVKTPMTEPMLSDPIFSTEVLSNIPMGRLASVDDVANSVVFLGSELSASTTGSCLKVDAGWTAR